MSESIVKSQVTALRSNKEAYQKRGIKKQIIKIWFSVNRGGGRKVFLNQIKKLAIPPPQPYQNLKKIVEKKLACSSPPKNLKYYVPSTKNSFLLTSKKYFV